MSKYTVSTIDGQRTCGHSHKTAKAASKCRIRLLINSQYYGAVILKNGKRTAGTGCWEDGEPCP